MAKGPGGTIIGRIGVRVLPDTSRFRQSLLGDLRRIERGLELDVDIEPDLDGFARRANRMLAAEQAKIRDVEAKLRVDVSDLDHTSRDITALRREIESVSSTPIGVQLFEETGRDLERYRDRLDAIVRSQERLNLARAREDKRGQFREVQGIPGLWSDGEWRKAHARIDAWDNRLAAVGQNLYRDLGFDLNVHNLDEVREKLHDLISDYDGKKIELEAELAEVSRRHTQAQLMLLARSRIVNLYPLVDSKAARVASSTIAALSGGRLLSATFDNLWDIFKNLDKNLPIVALLGTGLMTVAAWAASAASNIFSLSKGLVEMTGAALLLPGLMAGFGVGLGSLVASLKDFNRVLPHVADDLNTLRREMSGAFWAQAAAPIEAAFDGIYSAARGSLHKTSTALGVWASRTASSFAEVVGPSMPRMFRNLNASILLSSDSTREFAGIIEILGRRGSEYLPRLAGFANKVTVNFRDWLREGERTGRLNEIMETGVVRMREFGWVVQRAGGVLRDLATAAERAGGSTLGSLAEKLRKIREVTSGGEFQDRLTTSLRASHEAMSEIADRSGPRVTDMFRRLSDIFRSGLPHVAAFMGELVGGLAEALSTRQFADGLLDFFSSLRLAVSEFDGSWSNIGDGIGAVLRTLGSMAEDFAPLLAKLLDVVSDSAQRLGPHLERIADNLSGRLLGAMTLLHGPVVLLAESFAILVSGLSAVPGLLESVVLGIVGLRVAVAAGKAIDALSKALGAFAAGGALSQFLTVLGPAGSKIQGFGTKAVGALGAVAAFVAGPWGIAIAALAIVPGVIYAIGDALAKPLELPDIGANELADEIRRVAIAGDDLADSTLASVVGATGSWEDALVSLGGEMRRAFDPRWYESVIAGRQHIQTFEDRASALDDALADMVRNGNVQDAQKVMADLMGTAAENGVEWSKLEDLFPGVASALEAAGVEASQAEEDFIRAGEAAMGLAAGSVEAAGDLDVYREALEGLGSATPAVLASIAEAAAGFVDLQGSLFDDAGLERDLASFTSVLEGQKDQAIAWADDMAVVAERGNMDVVRALMELGPEAAGITAELAAASQEDFDRFVEVAAFAAGSAVDAFGAEFTRIEIVTQRITSMVEEVLNGTSVAEIGSILGADFATGISQSMLENTPGLATAVAGVEGIIDGSIDLSTVGSSQVALWMGAIIQAVEGSGGDLSGAGLAAGESVSAGMDEGLAGLGTTAADGAIAAAGVAATDGSPSFATAGATLGGALGQGLAGSTATVYGAAGSLLAGSTVAVDAWRGPYATSGVGLGGALGAGIVSTSGVVSGAAGRLLAGSTVALTAWQGPYKAAGVSLGSSVGAGLGSASGPVSLAAGALARGGSTSLQGWVGPYATTGTSLGTAVGTGLNSASASVNATATRLASSMGVSLDSAYSSAFKAGANAGQGLLDGLNSKRQAIASASSSVGTSVSTAFRGALVIKSPSRVARRDAEFWGDGVILGLEDRASAIRDTASRVAEQASIGMRSTLAGVRGDLTADVLVGDAVAPVYVTVNGTDVNNAEEVASTVLWEARRARRGGVYRERELVRG